MKTMFLKVHRWLVLLAACMLVAMGLPAALSADAQVSRKEVGLQAYPVAASTTIYKGAMVCEDADGYLVPAADTQGYKFAGFAAEQIDNSSGSDGDYNCRVYTIGTFLVTFSSITQAMVGDIMFVVDDATADDTSSNFVACGRLVEYVSATSGWLDIGQRALVSGGPDKLHLNMLGEGYSLNLISVTSTCTAGEGTRGLRINVTTSASIASGDLQCVHGYLTLGASATIAANAAIYPLSGWLDVPDSISIGNSALLAGCRVIFDPNNNDLTNMAAGGESALFYGNVWASTGKINHGLSIVAGAGTTIEHMIHQGGSGTINKIFDFTEWPDATSMMFMQGGPSHVGATAHFQISIGRQTDHAGIVGEVGASDYGSLYISVATGQLFQNQSGTWTDIS